jgi:hypothetical protein
VSLPAAEQRARAVISDVTSEDEARGVITWLRQQAQALRAESWEPYVWQRPHLHPDGWVSERWPGRNVCDARCDDLPAAVPPVHGMWLQRGGRGTGKTEGAAHYVDAHVNGPPCDPRAPGGHRLTIAAPTQADAVSSCVTGVSGLQAVNPLVTVTTTREGTTVRWPNGAIGRLLGAHTSQDVDRARAWSNVCLWWLEEAAAMPRLGGLDPDAAPGMLDQAPFTLRLHTDDAPTHPHMVVTTTPKNRPEVIALLARPDKVETWGRTRDAHRLDPAVREALEDRFGGTTAGAQELDGDQIKDTPAPSGSPTAPTPSTGSRTRTNGPASATTGSTATTSPVTGGCHTTRTCPALRSAASSWSGSSSASTPPADAPNAGSPSTAPSAATATSSQTSPSPAPPTPGPASPSSPGATTEPKGSQPNTRTAATWSPTC